MKLIVFLAVLRWKPRFWTNGHGNLQATHRSNRFFLRNMNMESISSINQHTVQIESKKETHQNFNRGFLDHLLMESQTTSCYAIYKLYSTKSLTQSKQTRVLKSDLSWWAVTDSVDFGFDDAKQAQQIASGSAWDDPCSSSTHDWSLFLDCHGSCRLILQTRLVIDSWVFTCKQQFNNQYR